MHEIRTPGIRGVLLDPHDCLCAHIAVSFSAIRRFLCAAVILALAAGERFLPRWAADILALLSSVTTLDALALAIATPTDAGLGLPFWYVLILARVSAVRFRPRPDALSFARCSGVATYPLALRVATPFAICSAVGRQLSQPPGLRPFKDFRELLSRCQSYHRCS